MHYTQRSILASCNKNSVGMTYGLEVSLGILMRVTSCWLPVRNFSKARSSVYIGVVLHISSTRRVIICSSSGTYVTVNVMTFTRLDLNSIPNSLSMRKSFFSLLLIQNWYACVALSLASQKQRTAICGGPLKNAQCKLQYTGAPAACLQGYAQALAQAAGTEEHAS